MFVNHLNGKLLLFFFWGGWGGVGCGCGGLEAKEPTM